MRITRAIFIKAVGVEPHDDDLERCNCNEAGQIGHLMCGWDRKRGKPVFIPDPPPITHKGEKDR